MTAAARGDWRRTRERGNWLSLRVMAWIALALGRPAARLALLPVTAYFLCFAPAARRASALYLERVLGRRPRLAERWRHFHAFASVALDRLWFVRGETGVFDIAVDNAALVERTLAEGRGAFLVGAHVGSFEALHAVGAANPGMRVAMVMYPDNAQLIHRMLDAVAPGFRLGIIGVGRAGSTLAIRDWLDGGGLAGLLADRGGHAASNAVRVPFLGHEAPFPDGPFRLAMLLKRRVVFMVGLYRGGRRYDVRFDTLADFSQPPDAPAARERLVRQAVVDYVGRLEALVREQPDNWFNFHDVWHDDRAP